MFAVMAGVMLLVYCAACYYIGARFFGWLRLLVPTLPALLFWIIYAVAALGMVFALTRREGWLAYVGGVWIAVFLYSFIINVAIDLVRLISRLFTGGAPAFANPTVLSGAMTLALVVAVIAGGMVNAQRIRTVYYDIPLSAEQQALDGMTVAVISDLHLGAINGYDHTKRVVDAVNAAAPDLVCIVGDVFDGDYSKAKELDEIEVLLRGIQSRYGVYAVLGNHDTNDPSSEGAAFLARAGVTLLYDSAMTLDNGVVLVGRADYAPISSANGRQALVDIAHDDGYVIVLDHQPQQAAADEAQAAGAQLMLSGHTHRGQIFPANLMTRLMYPTHYGVLDYGGLTMAVTSGAATWGPPLRVGTNSEVMVLTLRAA